MTYKCKRSNKYIIYISLCGGRNIRADMSPYKDALVSPRHVGDGRLASTRTPTTEEASNKSRSRVETELEGGGTTLNFDED